MSEEFRGVTLERYAELLAELARSGQDRETLLERLGFSETDWEAIDEHFQTLLERADEETGDDQVPEIMGRFSQAFARGSSLSSEPELSFEEYASIVQLARQGAELHRVLEQRRVPIQRYLDAHAHYLKRMLQDPELERRFAALLTRR